MSMFSLFRISASAMSAERQRAEVVAANMANAETTKTAEGGPYRRKQVVFSSSGSTPFRMLLAGFHGAGPNQNNAVRISQVVDDPTAPVMKYEPGHPDANAEGYVAYPAINPTQEMVDLMDSVRAYQLNAAAVSSAKQMIQQSLEIIR